MSGLAFYQLRSRYEAALAAERAHDVIAMSAASFVSAEAETDNERLTDMRHNIEDELMKVPSPDASAFAFKYLVAHGGGRDTDCWDGALEQEAKQFSAPSDCSGSPIWTAALTDYEVKRKQFDDCDLDADTQASAAMCDAWCEAMDHLVEAVRAPNVEAAVFKVELAKERWDGFMIPDEWLDAFAADLRHLVGATDPHIGWLAERNALLRLANTTVGISDDDAERLLDQACAVEKRIMQAPAASQNGLLAKAVLIVCESAMQLDQPAMLLFEELKSFGLVEREG